MPETRVIRYSLRLESSPEDARELGLYNPGYLASPWLEVTRVIFLGTADDTRILRATVGDRPLFPLDLPASVPAMMATQGIFSFVSGPPRWHLNEWLRIGLDHPAGCVVLLRRPEPEECRLTDSEEPNASL